LATRNGFFVSSFAFKFASIRVHSRPGELAFPITGSEDSPAYSLTLVRQKSHNKKFPCGIRFIYKECRPFMATATSSVARGVQPIRTGQGHSFLLRRLHSLSGIVPVGLFLIEHFFSNAFATNGWQSYADQVKFLTGLPFVLWLEIIGIYIPLAYHSLYGFYIWYGGESNVAEYPWAGNFMYSAQRWTGAIAFLYIGWHTYTMRFSGIHLLTHSQAAFHKVQAELHHPWALAFYVVAIVAASWHFAYGLYLFCAKWGITVSERSRRRFGVVCAAIAVIFIAVGLATLTAFFRSDPKFNPPASTWENQTGGGEVTR
jgi:succinate dehydrogenase / fumarate reductase, cytochrome b subunit